ncbi:MAG TPA: hypothetical protein VMA95_02105 [Streptosporangiaceae bacterium]|nr:hypothetical protein [Streptosporangiaceae bacterium]
MRDPDLVFRAQLAAAALEGAWHRWRVVHGLTADPTPTVSSYVGYSLEEPWGQPRVVFGLAAEDAEQLATMLERHDCVGPVYAAVATSPGARESGPGNGVLGRFAPLPVPRQSPGTGSDLPGASQSWTERWARERFVDLSGSRPDDGEVAGLGEPVFRQAAAAMQEAAEARLRAERGEGTADDEAQEPAGAVPGNLAQAATAARAEAEARIRAALEENRRQAPPEQPLQPSQHSELPADAFAPGRPGPVIHATDVLEPLPSPDSVRAVEVTRPIDLTGGFGDRQGGRDTAEGRGTPRHHRHPRRDGSQ